MNTVYIYVIDRKNRKRFNVKKGRAITGLGYNVCYSKYFKLKGTLLCDFFILTLEQIVFYRTNLFPNYHMSKQYIIQHFCKMRYK